MQGHRLEGQAGGGVAATSVRVVFRNWSDVSFRYVSVGFRLTQRT